jgi:hypothetical protein
MDLFLDLEPGTWNKNPEATIEQIRVAEQSIRYKLPEDYVQLLLWSNGGEGFIGNTYWALWSVEEINQLNIDYQIASYLPGLIAIGSDGGGECIALDYRTRTEQPAFVNVPFCDLSSESITPIGSNLREAIKNQLGNFERQV